jgi:hypothetical protein
MPGGKREAISKVSRDFVFIHKIRRYICPESIFEKKLRFMIFVHLTVVRARSFDIFVLGIKAIRTNFPI